jgi:AcrR family transcriptional regulator
VTETQIQLETRQRLLEAAAEVFVEKGYRTATIRDICQKAGANIAAVNYHFGNKEALYRELLLSEPAKSFQRRPRDVWRREGMTPEQLLRGFVHDFLQRLLDPEKPAWHAILVTREIVDPTEALAVLLARVIRPQVQGLGEIIKAVAGRELPPETLVRCTESVIPQIIFHLWCRRMMEMMHPQRQYDAQEIAVLADHITRFSIAGIRAVAEGGV